MSPQHRMEAVTTSSQGLRDFLEFIWEFVGCTSPISSTVVGREFKMGFATGCFGHCVFLVTHDAVKYSNGH